MQPTLPIELFESIVSHIQDRTALLSLLLTSRAFNYDAEKVLYRTVSLGIGEQNIVKNRLLGAQLASCKRVAAFVQSLTIDPYKFSMQRIRSILRLTHNLCSLSIPYRLWQNQFLLSDITNGTSFKLKSLNINCYHQQDLKDFIHSQRQISSFTWLPRESDSHNFPAISDLSNITTLDSTPEFLQYILPHRPLRRLHLGSFFSLTDPIPHLEVLSSLYLPHPSELATLFPNLRYLEGCLSHKVQLQQHLQFPPHLERLRILIHFSFVEPDIDTQTLLDHIQTLFENNANMWYVEIGYDRARLSPVEVIGVKVRLLGEGKEKQSETFRLDAWDWTEWKKW